MSNSYWLDVGTPVRYLQAHQDIINRKIAGFEAVDDRGQSEIALTAQVSDNSFIGNKCFIDRAAIVSDSVLGANVSIGENASIENSVIGSNTQIGNNAHLSSAIIGQNCQVGSFAAINRGAVIGDNTVLTDYSKV